MARPRRIGLTGGIGSGKSQVATLLRQAGLPVIDLDALGREVTETLPEAAAIFRKECGDKVFNGPKLDRKKARECLFSDEPLRKRVEAALHPIIWQAFESQCQRLGEEGARLIVCEAALLIETGLTQGFDGLIVVSAPEKLRKERLMARDRVSALLAEKMIRAQAREVDRRKHATWILENTGSLGELTLRTEELIDSWRQQGWL